MAVGFKIKGFENLSRKIRTQILGAVKKDETFKEVADIIIKSVRSNPMKRAAQAGKSYKPELEESTINRRKILAKTNRTHPKYSPSRNNLTFTGQLLDSLKPKIIVGKSRLIIEPTGTHKRYKGAKGRLIGKSIKNVDLARHVEELREFLFITPKELSKVVKSIRKRLRKALRTLR